MVVVAQLVRAPGCGPGGREFNPPRSPTVTHNIWEHILECYLEEAVSLHV